MCAVAAQITRTDAAAPEPVDTDTAVELVERFPGPALLVDVEGRVLASSQPARPLAVHRSGQRWWQRLWAWVSGGLGRGEPVCVTEIDTSIGIAVIEWTATVLPPSKVVLLGRDVTAERTLHTALVDSRQRFRALVDLVADFAWETDAQGLFRYMSPGGALGHAATDLSGWSIAVLYPEEPLHRTPFEARTPIEGEEIRLLAADGSMAYVQVWAVPILDGRGRWCGARGLCRDVTADRQRQQALARARLRQRVLDDVMRAIRDEIEPDGMRRRAVEAVAQALGAVGCDIDDGGPMPDRVVLCTHGTAIPDGLLPDVAARAGLPIAGVAPALVAARTEAGHCLRRPTWNSGRCNGAVAVWRRAGDRPFDEEEAETFAAVAAQLGVGMAQADAITRFQHLAERDGLSGVYNRRTFRDKLAAMLTAAPAGGALLYLDVDNFKSVNDRLGHQAGDALIRIVAERLQAKVVETAGMAGRMGGDEFVLWIPDPADRGDAVARDLTRADPAMAEMTRQAGIAVALSVGLTDWRGRADTLDALIARADGAMYRAKGLAKQQGRAGGLWIDRQCETGTQGRQP